MMNHLVQKLTVVLAGVICICLVVLMPMQVHAAGEIFPRIATISGGDLTMPSGGVATASFIYTRGNFSNERCVMRLYSGSTMVYNYEENMNYISGDYAGQSFNWNVTLNGASLGDGQYTMEVYTMVFDGKKWLDNFAGHIVSKVMIGTAQSIVAQDASFYAPVFNANYFYNHNPDVAAAIGYDENKLLQFFIKQGMAEGRKGSENFDMEIYRYWNRDLLLTYANDYQKYYMHYLNYGQFEGRIACIADIPK